MRVEPIYKDNKFTETFRVYYFCAGNPYTQDVDENTARLLEIALLAGEQRARDKMRSALGI